MPLRRRGRTPRPSKKAWTAAIERLRRAVDRYHSCVQLVPDRSLRGELAGLGAELEAAFGDFENAFEGRSRLSADHDLAALGRLHRAATLCAHATEAALMANEAAWRYGIEDVARRLDTVRTLVRTIDELAVQSRPPR